MKFTLNNKQEEIKGKDKITVQELLEMKKFSWKLMVVKVNGKVIKKEDFNKTDIREGDNVSVMLLMAGG